MYKALKDNRDNIGGFLKSSLLVSWSFCLLVCLLLFAFSPFIAINRFLFVPLTIQVLCDSTVAISLSSARFEYRYKEVAAIGLITSLLPALISILLLWFFDLDFHVRIYAMLLISVCTATFSLIRILKMKGGLDGKIIKKFYKTSLPLVPHSVGNALSGQSDKLILSWVMGAAALAKYSVIHSLGVALQFAVGAIGSALCPWIIRRLDSGEKEKIADLSALLLSGFSALNLCIIAAAPEAMQILAPKEYLDALPALLPISFTPMFALISMITTVSLVHSERGRLSGVLTLLGSVIGVFLNFMLIPKFGYFGAGTALLLSQAFSVISGLIFLKKNELTNVINLPSAIKSLMVSAVVGLLMLLLKNNLSARVFLLIIPAVMLLNNLFSVKNLIFEKKAKFEY